MLDDRLQGLIRATSETLNLAAPVIEKDYYVTQVIHALAHKINDNFVNLANAIINHDVKQFNNQHPEYSDDPIAEIRRSLAILKSKSLWKERYQEFIETMVYDNTFALEYDRAIRVLEQLSEGVIESLESQIV